MSEKELQKTETAPVEEKDIRADCGCTYMPATDIIEDVDEYRVVLDLPGAQPGDVDIRFENRRLTVRAKCAAESKKRNYLFREFGVGDYEREFRVTETVDTENISAETHDGQLILHLPKAGSALPRKIEVKPNGNGGS